MKLCVICRDEIHPLRMKILPNTNRCVKCSNTDRVYGHTIISGKNTYSEIQLVSMEMSENLSKLGKRYGQGVAAGVRFKYDPKHK